MLNHGFQVGKKLNVFRSVVCPDYGVVGSAPDKDGDWDDDQVEGVKESGISKIKQVDSILCDCVLNAVESKDEQVANDKLGDDEEKVDGEFMESKNVPSVFSTKACMVGVIDAHGWQKDPHPSDEVCIQRSTTNC